MIFTYFKDYVVLLQRECDLQCFVSFKLQMVSRGIKITRKRILSFNMVFTLAENISRELPKGFISGFGLCQIWQIV